jgi:hypothetical protein
MVELSACDCVPEKETSKGGTVLTDETQTLGTTQNNMAAKNPEVPPPGQILSGKQEHCETNILRQAYKC